MNLSENLHYLRKRDKITQEELAERLGVSRQSVSKWETGEAYPETDKLITLCDMFGVSLDALLRTDLTAETVVSDNNKEEADGKAYTVCTNKFSRAVAIGVFLILTGVAICVALSGYSFALDERNSELVSILGGVAVLVFVAVAIFLFSFFGMSYDRFQKENPAISAIYSDEEKKAFNNRFNLFMALLVPAILADVVFLIVLTTLINEGIIFAARADEACCYVVSAFLLLLAFIVGGMVYLGIQHSKYNGTEKRNKTTKNSKLKDALCGAVMMIATALFLILGFVGGWWHPGWVVFPIGGIICGIISAIMNVREDD